MSPKVVQGPARAQGESWIELTIPDFVRLTESFGIEAHRPVCWEGLTETLAKTVSKTGSDSRRVTAGIVTCNGFSHGEPSVGV
jgi:hypothetical protein